MNTIKECFNTILCGNRQDSRLAARQVKKLLYNLQDQDKFKDIKNIINNASSEYDKISENWRQENFVIAISVIYFLHDHKKQPDFLFSWLFYLLQHENGYIRHAAVRMLKNELSPLTVYIRFPKYKPESCDPTPEQTNDILYSLFLYLDDLSAFLWLPKYKRYKYINSLPIGPYKSTQMVLAYLEELCGRKFLDRLVRQGGF